MNGVTIESRRPADSKIHALHHRVPSLPHLGAVRGMAGFYTINRQDEHPLIEPSPIEGFALANGSAGTASRRARGWLDDGGVVVE